MRALILAVALLLPVSAQAQLSPAAQVTMSCLKARQNAVFVPASAAAIAAACGNTAAISATVAGGTAAMAALTALRKAAVAAWRARYLDPE